VPYHPQPDRQARRLEAVPPSTGQREMTEKLTISIAMATYNGESFLREQLDSFLWQTRLPDELVVCDDGSNDRTLDILDRFARQAPFPVKTYCNPKNLGSSKNFEKAINLCSGDLIYLSDQDDVWLPDKLREMEQAFLKYPNASYAFSDAFVVDEKLKILRHSLGGYYHLSFDDVTHFPPGDFFLQLISLRHMVIHGCTIVLNAQFRDYLLPIPDYWAHDEWISIMGSLAFEVIAVPSKLINYRQHSKQQYGVITPMKRLKQFFIINRNDYLVQSFRWQNALAQANLKGIYLNAEIKHHILNRLEHYRIRGTLSNNIIKNLPFVISELRDGRYTKYSNGWKSALKDIVAIDIKLLRSAGIINKSPS